MNSLVGYTGFVGSNIAAKGVFEGLYNSKNILSAYASAIYYFNKILYYHCYREGSITTLRTEKSLRDWIEMCMQQYRDLAVWGYPADELDIFLKNVALTYCIQKKPDADDANYAFCRKTLQSAKQIPKDFTWKRKVLLVLLKYCPPLFELVCEMWGKRRS